MKLIDHSLQISLCNNASKWIEARAEAFVQGADGVLAYLEKTFTGAPARKPAFPEVLRAVVIVCKCSTSMPPGPSEARGSRQLINTLCTSGGDSIFEVAHAMKLHKFGVRLMETARLTAACGLADESSDQQLNSMFAGVGETFAIAFDSGAVAFAQQGEESQGFTMDSYKQMFDASHFAAVELKMVVKAWSTMRAEERLQDIGTIMHALLMVAQVVMSVGASSFSTLSNLVALVGEPTPVLPSSSTLDVNVPAHGELAELAAGGGEQASSIVEQPSQCIGSLGQKVAIVDSDALATMQRLATELPDFRNKLMKHIGLVSDALEEAHAIDDLLAASFTRSTGRSPSSSASTSPRSTRATTTTRSCLTRLAATWRTCAPLQERRPSPPPTPWHRRCCKTRDTCTPSAASARCTGRSSRTRARCSSTCAMATPSWSPARGFQRGSTPS